MLCRYFIRIKAEFILCIRVATRNSTVFLNLGIRKIIRGGITKNDFLNHILSQQYLFSYFSYQISLFPFIFYSKKTKFSRLRRAFSLYFLKIFYFFACGILFSLFFVFLPYFPKLRSSIKKR